jgi:Flp pilus assembly pilin Flp
MKRLLEDEKGQGMTEYIIIVAIIAVAAIAIMTFFGDAIKARFAYVVAVITGQSTTSAESTMKAKSTGANTEAGQSSKKAADF